MGSLVDLPGKYLKEEKMEEHQEPVKLYNCQLPLLT